MKSNQAQEQLIVFTRYPEPGTTKTRLAKVLGDQGAASMQKKLTEQTLSQVKRLQQMRQSAVTIYYTGANMEQMQEWLGPDLAYRKQASGNLGTRMAAAFAAAFRNGYKRIVLIGSDCPGLKANYMQEAFECLRHKDLVIGPASDGGYYLIGLRQVEKALFEEISWSTPAVLSKTLKIAAQTGVSIALLETLSDVDRPEDLEHINYRSCP